MRTTRDQANDPKPATPAEVGGVLLVDDNDDLRSSTAELLREQGFIVHTAADATAARALAASVSFDVLVTDVRMPGDDGLALAAGLRSARPSLPVVFVSSHLDDRLAARLERDDVAFVRKPFAAASLVTGIEQALAAARRARPRTGTPPWRRVALAAAVVIVALGGLAFWRSASPPPLPDVESSSVRRSYRVEPLGPLGTSPLPPTAFRWREVEGATRYTVSVERPGDELIWQGHRATSPMAWPDDITIEAAVRYVWRVEAFDAGARRIAWSEAARFSWLPADGGEPIALQEGG